MLHLSSPSGLFENKKVYHVSGTTGPAKGNSSAKAIVAYRYNSEKLPEPLQQMLDRLLQACKFAPSATEYINMDFNTNISLGTIKETYPAEVLLIFGETGLERNLQKLKRNIPFLINGLKIIQAESLTALNGNDKEKKALWGGLQKLLTL
jgi:hypothetical protein